MDKQNLIEKLLKDKAEKDNTIDLNAYALGLDAMYEALRIHDVSGEYCECTHPTLGKSVSRCGTCDKWFKAV